MTKIGTLYGNRIFRIVAAILVVFVYFFGLNVPLLGPDEPRYSQVAREMFQRGDWITPTLGGFHWFEKPVLLYWLQILSYNIFGVSEFSARFGSTLFGLATVAALWLLGQTYSKAAGEVKSEIGFWLVVVSASSIGLIAFARGASFDIILTFPMTAAMVSFFVYELRSTYAGPSEKPGPRTSLPLISFYFFIGISLLAKGLIGIVFPFGIVVFYYLLSWRVPTGRFLLSFAWGTVLALLVAGLWYWPMYTRHGWEFVDEFFIQHHFQRYTSNKYLHPQPFYFFFLILPAMTIPWLPFFLSAVWRYGKALIGQVGGGVSNWGDETNGFEKKDAQLALVRFTIAWMLVPLAFFSFSGSKLPGYILPSLPPALILATLYVVHFIRKKKGRERVILITAGTMVAVTMVLIATVLPKFADSDSVKRLIDTADNSGYRDAKVLNFHTVSHNAEFYAPGRLIRDESGKLRKFVSTNEMRNELDKNGWESALVLVPLEYSKQLNETTVLHSEPLANNGEYLIAKISRASN